MKIEGMDYTETFSTVSCKDSFIIIMALMVPYDLELHQMNVRHSSMGIYMRMYTCHNPKVLSWKEKNICDVTRRNPFMD
jgi:hypothetical protein